MALRILPLPFWLVTVFIIHLLPVESWCYGFMYPGFIWTTKIVAVQLHYSYLQILWDIDSILVSYYIHLLYPSLWEITWICFDLLQIAMLHQHHQQCHLVVGNLIRAITTIFLGPLMYFISCPYSSSNNLHLIIL